jgi:hypothetical protein
MRKFAWSGHPDRGAHWQQVFFRGKNAKTIKCVLQSIRRHSERWPIPLPVCHSTKNWQNFWNWLLHQENEQSFGKLNYVQSGLCTSDGVHSQGFLE